MTESPQGAPGDAEPHRARGVAESFGADAERYDRARRPYPGALIDGVAERAPGPEVLDVGSGTGIAARQFQQRGCTVLGVEPDARMAAVARRRGLASEEARFEEWDPAGRRFDAVVSAQSWHWIDPGAGAGKAAGVLRPGGLLAAFWNVYAPPPEVAEQLGAAFRRAVPDAPFDLAATLAPGTDPYAEIARSAADGLRGTGRFGEPEHWHFTAEQTIGRDEWLALLPTQGAFTRLPQPVLSALLAEAAAAADAHGGSFALHIDAVAVAAVRT